MNIIKNLYNYRELLKTNIKKEIRGKYKASFLGVLWSFVNPLLMVMVYAIVFPYIMRQNIPNYLIYLIVALIPWNFFTVVISQGASVIIQNGGIIKKVYFPREILPISVVTSGLINFLISSVITLIFVLFSGIGITWTVIFFPFIALIQYVLCLGIVFIVSSINVYIRDLEYIVNFIVQMLFYATPILYSLDMFPERMRWLFMLNPMAHIVTGYRDILYYQVMPQFNSLFIVLIISVIIMICGYAIFMKLEKGFAEEL